MKSAINTKKAATIRFAIWIIVCHFSMIQLLSQEIDSAKVTNIEFITDQLENLAQTTDLSLDYSDLVDDYMYLIRYPISLNSDDIGKLQELHLINEIQLNNLRSYVGLYGPLYSIYELKVIAGYDNKTIQNILPFVTTEQKTDKISLNPGQVFKYGSHQIIFRYQQILESSNGYSYPPDSAITRPGSIYLGNPQAYYLRYGFNYRNKVRFGFVLDKDAGEVLLKRNLSDSIRVLVGGKANSLVDFFSGHIYVSDLGILKKAVLGDYHLEVGQGLTLWTGLAFGKSAEAMQVKRYGRGIRPNTSRNENRFFRGGAVTLGWKGVSLTGFYSRNNVDATLVSLLSVDKVKTIIETGLHRTISELFSKDAIAITAYGGRLGFTYKRLGIGATAFQTRLSTSMITGKDIYREFYFSGDNLINYGADLNLNFNKVNIFGEFSASSNGGFAGLAGFNAYLTDRFSFTVFYHDYGRDYHNLYSNPMAESSAIANEKGLYFGFRALIHRQWSLSGYIDHFQFPWLKYRIDGPSTGRDYLLQINYTTARNVEMYLRYRYKNKQENYADDYDYTDKLAEVARNEFRVFISYRVFDFLILKNRLDFTFYNKQYMGHENGYMIYQDILYRPNRFPLEVTFRYALFDTDGYDSRIYAYENDVLYAFTVPAYFDSGQRTYLMLKWKALKQLDVWLRISRSTFSNRRTVGSGTEEINGNKKTEVKLQLMVKL